MQEVWVATEINCVTIDRCTLIQLELVVTNLHQYEKLWKEEEVYDSIYSRIQLLLTSSKYPPEPCCLRNRTETNLWNYLVPIPSDFQLSPLVSADHQTGSPTYMVWWAAPTHVTPKAPQLRSPSEVHSMYECSSTSATFAKIVLIWLTPTHLTPTWTSSSVSPLD